jgi:peptide/nickel transport system permease protein
MLRYLIRRLVALVVLLVVTSAITFALFFAAPVAPEKLACGPRCQDNPERIAEIKHTMGLDKPLVEQYGVYMKGLVLGRDFGSGTAKKHCPAPCFGRSFQNGKLVWAVIKSSAPITFSLAIGAAILWLFAGVALGVIAAMKRGTWVDRLAVGFSLFGASFPVILTALLALYFVCHKWHLLPVPESASASLFGDGPWPWFQTFLLPWVVLAMLYASMYVRLTRANMIETMGEDYIRTARAKGLDERAVTRHGLRAALTPIVTIFGLDLGGLLGGAALTEKIFGLTGIGYQAVEAARSQDLPMIMGVVLFAAFFIIVANIIVDVLYRFVDPRVRLT